MALSLPCALVVGAQRLAVGLALVVIALGLNVAAAVTRAHGGGLHM